MNIIIKNNAKLPNKYLRFAKWKIYKIKQKFQHLIYTEIFLNSEGQGPTTHIATIRLGIPGHDIIIQHKSKDLNKLFKKSTQSIHRYLAKHKNLEKDKRNKLLLETVNK